MNPCKIADSSAARVGGLRRSRVPEGSIADWPLQHDSARQEPRAFFVWKIGIGGVELAAHRVDDARSAAGWVYGSAIVGFAAVISEDRKSVVSGTSVSVRVDPGGRRQHK